MLKNLRTSEMLTLSWNELLDIWKTSTLIQREAQRSASPVLCLPLEGRPSQPQMWTQNSPPIKDTQKDLPCSIFKKVGRSDSAHTRYHKTKHPAKQAVVERLTSTQCKIVCRSLTGVMRHWRRHQWLKNNPWGVHLGVISPGSGFTRWRVDFHHIYIYTAKHRISGPGSNEQQI